MSSGNLAHKAYEHLQESIVSGKLVAGAVISEAAVAKSLGISRTPVGEAIRQLQREGLLEQVPRYGTIVRPWDLRELTELYEMREALETYAAAQAAERITPELLRRLSQLCEVVRRIEEDLQKSGETSLNEQMLGRFLAADMVFHLTIIEATGNRRMLETVKNMRTISRIFRAQRAWHDQRITHETCVFHQRIFEALQAGNGEAAREAMAEHIRASRQESITQHRQLSTSTGIQQDLPADLKRELDELEQEMGNAPAPASSAGRSVRKAVAKAARSTKRSRA